MTTSYSVGSTHRRSPRVRNSITIEVVLEEGDERLRIHSAMALSPGDGRH